MRLRELVSWSIFSWVGSASADCTYIRSLPLLHTKSTSNCERLLCLLSSSWFRYLFLSTKQVCRIIYIILAPPTEHYQQVTTVEQESLHSLISHTGYASLINTIIIKIILHTYLSYHFYIRFLRIYAFFCCKDKQKPSYCKIFLRIYALF